MSSERRAPIRTQVDAEVFERYGKRFGGYGSISFVVETAMREILELTEGSPEAEELVRRAIRVHVLNTHYSPTAKPQ